MVNYFPDDGKSIFIERTASRYTIEVQINSDLPKHDQMVVSHPILVELSDYRRVYIPAGFITDCHSTPPWSQSVLPAYDTKTNLAAIVHDYLYMNWERFQEVYPELYRADARAYTDGVYRELMERFQNGLPALERGRNRLYVLAVRAFGGWNWRKFRRLANSASQ